MYLAYLNYISYSWVAVLIVGVVAAGFRNSRCLTQPVLSYSHSLLSLGSNLAIPTTIFYDIDPQRDTVERVWPMRHVDRVNLGLDYTIPTTTSTPRGTPWGVCEESRLPEDGLRGQNLQLMINGNT